jgi:hypothetical protein
MARLSLTGLLVIALTAGCALSVPVTKPGTVNAAAVLEGFKAKGLPITSAIVHSAESDPNKLLGRPNGYESKVSFRDGRLPAQSTSSIDTDTGGTIEVYPDAAGARQRGESIAALVKDSPLPVEYVYTRGRVVLRLSREFTPDQAEQYRAVLAELPTTEPGDVHE